MKIAFINVNVKDHERTCLELEFFSNKCTLELGTRYLHANMRLLPGDEVEHFNLLFLTLNRRDWRAEIAGFRPDIVALSALSFYGDEMHEVADWAKRHTGAIVIAGGPYVTSEAADVLEQNPHIDFGCVGEGEHTFSRFIEVVRASEIRIGDAANDPVAGGNDRTYAMPEVPEVQGIPGLIYRKDGRAIANSRYVVEDLDTLKFPTLAEVDPHDFRTYSSQVNLKLNHMPIVTTRGCPYKCVYCHDIMGKQVRYRSPQSVIDEIEYWYNERNVDTFYINDDIFNVNKKRLKQIFREFARHKRYRFAFPNGLRADILDEEAIDLLVEGGTFFAVVAIESANEEVQNTIKKYLKLDRLQKTIEYFGKTGITLGAFNILGFPTETEDDIRRTVQFNTDAAALKKATFFLLNPHPGTEVYQMALDEGWNPLESSTQGYFNAASSSTTRHVAPERLVELRHNAYSTFYFHPDRIKRCREERNPNLQHDKTVEFHRVDYSYIMRQFLGMNSTADVADVVARQQLDLLLPQGLVAGY
jgi:anaerobic magnesium-protoporphyrin IX monomethyl ester cyclase